MIQNGRWALVHIIPPEFTKSQVGYLNNFLLLIFALATFPLKEAPRRPQADRTDASARKKPESRTNKGQNDTEQHSEGLFLTQVRREMEKKQTNNHCLKKAVRWSYAYQSVYFSKSAEPHSKLLKTRARRPKPQPITYSIFHVQVTGAPESEGDLQAEETILAGKKSTDETSAQLGEWGMLMDADPIPNLGERCTFILL